MENVVRKPPWNFMNCSIFWCSYLDFEHLLSFICNVKEESEEYCVLLAYFDMYQRKSSYNETDSASDLKRRLCKGIRNKLIL
jgi:hypothetical protein